MTDDFACLYSVSAKTENTFISAVISGHYYAACFVLVLAMVVLAVTDFGYL